jgi:hypothetical protein
VRSSDRFPNTSNAVLGASWGRSRSHSPWRPCRGLAQFGIDQRHGCSPLSGPPCRVLGRVYLLILVFAGAYIAAVAGRGTWQHYVLPSVDDGLAPAPV